MAFASAVGKALNNYFRDSAFGTYDFLSFQYEPQLIFGRQLREVVASMGGDFAKKNKNRRWLLVGYARTPVTYQLKRFDTFRWEGMDDFPSVWKTRQVHCSFKHVLISPSPELLEELEEKIVVKDYGALIPAIVDVTVKNPDKTNGPTFAFDFNVNLDKITIENFDHFSDGGEGMFSIFSVESNVNYPVFVPETVYDRKGVLRKIELSVRHGDEDNYVELLNETIE